MTSLIQGFSSSKKRIANYFKDLSSEQIGAYGLALGVIGLCFSGYAMYSAMNSNNIAEKSLRIATQADDRAKEIHNITMAPRIIISGPINSRNMSVDSDTLTISNFGGKMSEPIIDLFSFLYMKTNIHEIGRDAKSAKEYYVALESYYELNVPNTNTNTNIIKYYKTRSHERTLSFMIDGAKKRHPKIFSKYWLEIKTLIYIDYNSLRSREMKCYT